MYSIETFKLIKGNYTEIQKALIAGKEWKEICNLINTKTGLDISANKLRQYLKILTAGETII